MCSSRAAETGVAYMPPSIEEGGIRFLVAGDRFVLVEVGEGMELSLNIKVKYIFRIDLNTNIFSYSIVGSLTSVMGSTLTPW